MTNTLSSSYNLTAARTLTSGSLSTTYSVGESERHNLFGLRFFVRELHL